MKITLRQAFNNHSKDARARGIEFLLTFDEWLKIWTDSGKLAQRGRRSDQFCMARYGDKGAYVVGNVRIISGLENHRERQFSPSVKQRADHSKRMSGSGNSMFGKTHSQEARESENDRLKANKGTSGGIKVSSKGGVSVPWSPRCQR